MRRCRTSRTKALGQVSPTGEDQESDRGLYKAPSVRVLVVLGPGHDLSCPTGPTGRSRIVELNHGTGSPMKMPSRPPVTPPRPLPAPPLPTPALPCPAPKSTRSVDCVSAQGKASSASTARNTRARFSLKLEAREAGPAAVRRLRAFLKSAWRAFGLRCVGAREVGTETDRADLRVEDLGDGHSTDAQAVRAGA
jgi:hypothetical protein